MSPLLANSLGDKQMKRMLAYIRRSKESDERTVSIDTQRAEIEAYNHRNDLQTAFRLLDDGVSGGNRDRLIRIKEVITKEKLSGLVAYHLDRIARDTAAQLDLLEWFSKRKLEMHTCNQGLIRSKQSHEFLSIGVQSMMNEYHRRRCIEHGVATYEKHRDGNRRYSRFCPYGYEFTPENNIVENPDEQTNLSIIKSQTGRGHSATAIACLLNNQREFNRKGTPWSAGSIARIQRRILNAKS